jgi:predicted ABC-type ATPase
VLGSSGWEFRISIRTKPRDVRIWYVGLTSVELHIARVRRRVAAGGHDIPESKIRERYNGSRINLIRLIPKLTELHLYDNSEEADPLTSAGPEPMLILHLSRGIVVHLCELAKTPGWAKPIVATALAISR